MSDATVTPMFRQYRAVKDQYPGVILLFRLGDFYEMFGDDAVLASKELELTLTSREIGKGNRVPMCGVPYHAVERYIAQLISRGHRCALCDQTEDARYAKGLVKREVTRVLTAGTIVEDSMLAARANNFLASIRWNADAIGLALADVSTGDFWVTEFSGSSRHNALHEELERWHPAECLTPPSSSDIEIRLSSSLRATSFDPGAFFPRSAEERLTEQLGVHSLRGYGIEPGAMPLGVEAAATMMTYLQQTQLQALGHLKSMRVYSASEYMTLDPATRRNLELTQSLRDGSSRGTLMGLMDRTETAMGGRLLRQWLIQPLRHADAIRNRLDAVGFLVDNSMLRGDLRELLRSVQDMERLTSRAVTATASARDLVSLRRSLESVPLIQERIVDATKGGDHILLKVPEDLPALREMLLNALQEDPPHHLNEGGIIRPGYSRDLDELREGSSEGKDWIARLEATERERTGIKSLKVGFNQVFGYYLEITRANLSQVPADYIRKQTLSNAERFITPELKEMESRVLGAEEKIVHLEYELFCSIRETVAESAGDLLEIARAIAHIDAFAALAELAVQQRYARPEICDGDKIQIVAGRHPVIEYVQKEPFVPNDAFLNGDENQLLILTGPNMAGKSTYLRQVALTVLMAQMGSYVPCTRATIGVVDRIFTRVGAQDDLATGQSTFMVEMNETASILNNATERSLVILDEIGRGTSTFDGLSIAWAVAEALHDRGCKTLFATHYHHLNELENQLPRARNFRVAVKEEGERIVFLRRIVRGGTDRSYGIQVARLAGLPRSVIERAKQVLWTLEQEKNVGADPRDGHPSDIARPIQLKLFEPPHPVVDELRLIDVDTLTPLEAINKLHEWKRRVVETHDPSDRHSE